MDEEQKQISDAAQTPDQDFAEWQKRCAPIRRLQEQGLIDEETARTQTNLIWGEIANERTGQVLRELGLSRLDMPKDVTFDTLDDYKAKASEIAGKKKRDRLEQRRKEVKDAVTGMSGTPFPHIWDNDK